MTVWDIKTTGCFVYNTPTPRVFFLPYCCPFFVPFTFYFYVIILVFAIYFSFKNLGLFVVCWFFYEHFSNFIGKVGVEFSLYYPHAICMYMKVTVLIIGQSYLPLNNIYFPFSIWRNTLKELLVSLLPSGNFKEVSI